MHFTFYLYVVQSLGIHPEQTDRTDNQWTSESFSEFTRTVNEPFTYKVESSNCKSPHTNIVDWFVSHQEVGSVETYNGCDKRPSTKGSST